MDSHDQPGGGWIISNLRGLRPAPRTTRLPVLLLTLAATACGDDPTFPFGEPGEDPELLSIFAEPLTMAESDQLLANADMESGQASPTPWWSGSSRPQDHTFEWADGIAASGTRSLAIEPAAGPTGGFAFWAQTIDVVSPVGMTFEFSVDIKLEDVLGDGVAVAIRGDDSTLGNGAAEVFATTQRRMTVNGSQDWTTLSVQMNSVPAEIDQITVYLLYQANASGTAYFDDATLSVSASVPTVELRNTDMEDGDGYPDPWSWGGVGYTSYGFTWTDLEASAGTRSLAITRSQSHRDEFGFWAQTIDARDFAGGSATLSVRVRTLDLVGQGAAVAIRADDTSRPQGLAEAFATTQGRDAITGTRAWTTYQVTLSDIPANTLSLTVYLIHLKGTGGAALFDEASLVPG